MTAVMVGLPAIAGAQAPAEVEQTRRLMMVQALLGVDHTGAWRTDVWVEQGETVVRLTPTDRAAEWSPRKVARSGGLEARVRFGIDGRVARLRVRDRARPGIQVARGATSTARVLALSAAEYGAEASSAVLEAARARGWRTLGGAVSFDTPALAWRVTDGARERALWQLRASVTANGRTAQYLVTLDPLDGSLVELAREDGVR